MSAISNRATVIPGSHLPFVNTEEISIAKAERKARVAIVSAMTPPDSPDPLDLHKQQE